MKLSNDERLTGAITELSRTIRHLNEILHHRSCFDLATKQDLNEMECRIMSVISDYSEKVNTAFDQISTSVDGVVADVAALKKKIDDLQNSPGGITPEDQKLLDDIQARAVALSAKIKALDEATEDPIVEPPPVA